MSSDGTTSRRMAVEVLIRIERDKAYANIALANALKKKPLQERDRAFVTALVQGAVRRLSEIDGKIQSISKQPVPKLTSPLRNILRLAIFQLDYMPDIPPSAVLDTSNKLAKSTGTEGSAKFANGVLRNYLRAKAKAPQSDDTTDDATLSTEQLAEKYSMPPWLVERWVDIWGIEEALRLLKHSQQIPELALRTCELGITTEGLIDILRRKGIKCRPGELVDTCVIVEDRGPLKGPVEKLPGYDQGLFSVQDEAAAFVSKVVEPKSGEVVVDLCAAPGGKSLHMAELMGNKGRILAVDLHVSRLNLLRKSRQRLGITNIEIFAADGKDFTPDTLADKVLIDAPCTGTGVINRRSDLRLKREAPDIQQLITIQRDLLHHGASMLKPGGALVYSTCSIEPEENIDNFKWFIESHSDFEPASLERFIPPALLERWKKIDPSVAGSIHDGWLQILPSRHALSGFFICRFTKKALQ
jgi:16S rRNA (cytosine967-C5)-methyltransferase